MRRLTAAIMIAAGLGTALPAVAGSPATHVTYDVTGNVTVCRGKELTAAGFFRITLRDGSTSSGNQSSTGTIVPDVTFTDVEGNAYRLVGALRFGAVFNARRETQVLVDTEHFVVLTASGAPFGRISLTSHSSANGKEFSLDMGNCLDQEG
jgi:hypothetical protein